MGIWEYGVYGNMGIIKVWVYGCLGIWVYGYMGIFNYEYI